MTRSVSRPRTRPVWMVSLEASAPPRVTSTETSDPLPPSTRMTPAMLYTATSLPGIVRRSGVWAINVVGTMTTTDTSNGLAKRMNSGDGGQATGDRRRATGDGRQATGDGRQATGRQATGDRALACRLGMTIVQTVPTHVRFT